VKDQELNPRPHTPRPAALPVKVEQWGPHTLEHLQSRKTTKGNAEEWEGRMWRTWGCVRFLAP